MIPERIWKLSELADYCENAGVVPRRLLTGESVARQRFGGLMVIRQRFSSKAIHDTLFSVLENDLHAKRIKSLCDATSGV